MSSVSVVIPVYNAELSLEKLYNQLMPAMEATTAQFEVIMVEDHGKDGSWSITNKMVEQKSEVSVWPTGCKVNPTNFRILSKSRQ
jgi:glycosyltransferase involved in cell wall biosynthesis